MHHRFHGLASALALGLPLTLYAQGRANPADAGAPTRPLGHVSAFATYAPHRDIALGDWRLLNDRVGAAALRPGGAHPATPAPSPALPAPTQKEPMPHKAGPHPHLSGGRP